MTPSSGHRRARKMKSMSNPAPRRNIPVLFACLFALMTLSGCTRALGDFEITPGYNSSDGGGVGKSDGGTDGDAGPAAPCMPGAKECHVQDLTVCNASGV